MEKYGVDQEDGTKNASEEGRTTCPQCGAQLRERVDTGVLLCPTCGSKPFEWEPQ